MADRASISLAGNQFVIARQVRPAEAPQLLGQLEVLLGRQKKRRGRRLLSGLFYE